MNTIVMPTELSERGTRRPTHSIVTTLARLPERRPAEWLPVPQWVETSSVKPRNSRKPIRADQSLWAQVRRQSQSEALFMGVLVLAAALGIVYGFSCLVNLVQHWALFNAGVGRLIT